MGVRVVEGSRLHGLPASTPDASASGEDGAALLRELCGLAGRVDELDAAELGLAAPRARVTELTELLQRAVQCLQLLEELYVEQGDDELLGFEGEPTTLAGVPIELATSPKLADVCFAGVLELNRSAQELRQARSDDDVLVALETAARKLRRALRAVIETALLSGEAGLTGAEQLRGRDGFDLESTLAVRRLYAAFRRLGDLDVVASLRTGPRLGSTLAAAPAGTPAALGPQRARRHERAGAARRRVDVRRSPA